LVAALEGDVAGGEGGAHFLAVRREV
jgi:hypothetical protein